MQLVDLEQVPNHPAMTAGRRDHPLGQRRARAMSENLVHTDAACFFPSIEILFGVTARMQDLRLRIESAISTHRPVLIQGETGTGKEVIATFLHSRASWRNGRFLKVRCPTASWAGLEKELLEKESKPDQRESGNELAPREPSLDGSIFLDEIDELDLKMQARLLDGIQDDLTFRLTAGGGIAWRARMIFATQQLLPEEVKRGRFRQELMDRVRPLNLSLSPLRDRRADIPALAAYFLKLHQKNLQRDAPPLSEEWVRMLQVRQWPGNIRELENTICRYIILGPRAALLAEAERMIDYNLRNELGVQDRLPLGKIA